VIPEPSQVPEAPEEQSKQPSLDESASEGVATDPDEATDPTAVAAVKEQPDPPPKAEPPQAKGPCPPHPCPEKKPNAPYTGPKPLLSTKEGKIAYGGYGGLTVLATGIQGQAAMVVGGEGAFLMDHRFVLGIGVYVLTSMVNVDRYANGDRSLLLMGYGGPIIRYQFFGNGPLVLSVGALFGGGGLGFMHEIYDDAWEVEDNYSTGQVFFVLEPSIQGHVQLTRWMRAGVNLNYRAIQGVATRGVDDRGLSGFAGGAHLQFGWF